MAATAIQIEAGKVVIKGGKVGIIFADCSTNCCVSEDPCIFCTGCIEAHEVDCPGPCTPNTIEVVVAGVDAAKCTCYPIWDTLFNTMGTNTRVNINNSPGIDGTYVLTQVPGSCIWKYEKTVSTYHYRQYSDVNNCAGTLQVNGLSVTKVVYQLVRANSLWRFAISNDGAEYNWFGAGEVGDPIEQTAAGINGECDTVPTMTNAITCALNNNTLNSGLSTGGSATFTVCP